MKQTGKKLAYRGLGMKNSLLNRVAYKASKHSGKVAVYNTSMGTHNLGDHIIMQYCGEILKELFPNEQWLEIASHRIPTAEEESQLASIKYRFVCGTNLLTSTIEKWWNWRLPDGWKAKQKHNNAILLGAGWHEYEPDCTDYTTMIYRTVLNPCVLHSVRDQYSEMKLRQAGFKNVINTGCPTTWALTPEFCRSIPTKKANKVVTTITDYRRDPEQDRLMLEILCRNYEHVYIWLQGQRDDEYLDTLMCSRGGDMFKKVSTIQAHLGAYEAVLKSGDIDYVGTRLHAGIHALNHKVRSIIIAVDNRATEMGKDINLPIIQRQQLLEKLEARILSEFSTDIRIRQENIERFKSQFRLS